MDVRGDRWDPGEFKENTVLPEGLFRLAVEACQALQERGSSNKRVEVRGTRAIQLSKVDSIFLEGKGHPKHSQKSEKGVAMNWKELLNAEIESSYSVTEKLLTLVDNDKLEWKPSSGTNWMTTGQLLKHITESCGAAFRGFITGDWGLPEGVEMSELSPEEMLPPAEKMPTITSVVEAKQLLRADRQLANEMLAACSEEKLAHNPAPAPWDPTAMILGHRLLQMVDHLKQHKGQLFYYLKLQGKPVHTGNLWGM